MSGNEPSIGAGERIYLHIYDYETKEFSGLTTYHGLVRIYNSNTWPSRIFWCVVVLSCLSLFMIHSGYLLLGYHSKPTLFQVNTIVPDEGIFFPDITICNHNPVMVNKLSGWNMSSELLWYILVTFSDYLDMSKDDLLYYEGLFLTYKQSYLEQFGRTFNLAEFFRSTGPNCSDIILSCSYGGKIIEKCCEMTDLVMTDLGQCIRFSNSKLNKRQWFSGSGYGWQFVLDGKNHLRTEYLSESSLDLGFRVLVHETGKEFALRSHGVSVPPGTALHAGIDTKNISLLRRSDWGVCQANWDPLIHGEVVLPLKYTSTHCEWNCLLQHFVSSCNCVPLSMAAFNSLDICSPYQLQSCNAVEFVSNVAQCNCDVECEVMEYGVRMSYSEIISKSIREKYSVSAEYIEENISIANVFLRSITYERHEQQKQLQTADLLSNIAGSMGLFLGMSTVTLLEIFIYLFKSVWGTVNTERQKQFMEAMIEEENERRQSLVIVEEEQDEEVVEQESELIPPASQEPHRRQSRRASLAPLHIHMGRRGSRMIIRDNSFPDVLHVPRKSITVVPQLLPPSYIGTRKSVAGGMPGHRGSLNENVGTLKPERRGSTMQSFPHRPSMLLTIPSTSRRLSVQTIDDTIHLPLINHQHRRKSSVNPRNFLF